MENTEFVNNLFYTCQNLMFNNFLKCEYKFITEKNVYKENPPENIFKHYSLFICLDKIDQGKTNNNKINLLFIFNVRVIYFETIPL